MLGNLGKMMKMVGELKTRMPEMQAKLAASEYQAQAGGGAVAATVNGKMQLVGLEIDPDVLGQGDVDVAELADLIKAAVSAAQEQAAGAAREAMSELTGGMPLPAGLDSLMS